MNKITHYIVNGRVRGTISRHRLQSAAEKSRAKERRVCAALGGGAYSDVRVWAVYANGTAHVVEIEQ